MPVAVPQRVEDKFTIWNWQSKTRPVENTCAHLLPLPSISARVLDVIGMMGQKRIMLKEKGYLGRLGSLEKILDLVVIFLCSEESKVVGAEVVPCEKSSSWLSGAEPQSGGREAAAVNFMLV